MAQENTVENIIEEQQVLVRDGSHYQYTNVLIHGYYFTQCRGREFQQ